MKTIHHVLDIDSEPGDIWQALTEPPAMASWWSTSLESPPPALGAISHWTFEPGFNPSMEITTFEPGRELFWRCVGGHDPWQGSVFRFELNSLDGGRTRLRFWQDYAVELDDDAYGIYNYNWGYYLESLRLLCTTGTGKPYSSPG